MRNFLSRDQRQDSASSIYSSSSKSTISSLQTWYRKRKRNSVSPSPPPRQDSSIAEGCFMHSSTVNRGEDRGSNGQRLRPILKSAGHPHLAQDKVVVNGPQQNQQRNTSIPTDQIQKMHSMERIISNCRSSRSGKRRSSAHLPELLPPRDFTSEELRKPVELPKFSCPFSMGSVFRPHPERGIRVETKARSRESIILTTRPLYSARRQSPLVADRPHTAYFEGELRLGSDEDSVRLVLGFVAKTGHASRMPGMERGSIGISFRNGALYVGGQLLANAVCRPVEQVGIGLTFSKNDGVRAEEVDQDGHSRVVSSLPSVGVELFLTQNRKKVGSWNLSELKNAGNTTLNGLDGNHDLYAAVGTLKEVNVDIFFDKRDWKYSKTAK